MAKSAFHLGLKENEKRKNRKKTQMVFGYNSKEFMFFSNRVQGLQTFINFLSPKTKISFY